ncbi:MAG: hypothetical protein Q4Q03_07275 [Bowdeniella nasicola]|nr:hypothetical protein [Bowdeniella nasicola]
MANVTTSTPVRDLTERDRCDACGARAVVQYRLTTGELGFCGHHDRKHGAAIRERATVIAKRPGH